VHTYKYASGKSRVVIKAISFDMGGVLYSWGTPKAIEELVQQGYDQDTVTGILRGQLAKKLRKGECSEEEFFASARAALGDDVDLEKTWYGNYVIDTDVFGLVQQLSGKLPLMILSGNIEGRVRYLEQKYHFLHHFSKAVWSYEHHLDKHDKALAEILVREAGCKPEELIHVDDSDYDSRALRELGVHVIIYQAGRPNELRTQLGNLGIEL
jgi:FMN phosphatase YigB (HAD superfamily)